MVLNLALPCFNCVNLDIFLELFVAWYLYLKIGYNNSIYFTELL